MAMNRIQFQRGLSMPAFLSQFGTEAQCETELEQARWPHGFVCPCCDFKEASVFRIGLHPTFQCKSCRHQTSLTAGTLFENTKLPLTLWFLAIYSISQAKTGLSALALKRLLGVSYPTAWLLHHKIMAAMSERESHYRLSGKIDMDDAYLGGELSGGKAGRGSENKVPFVAALSFDEDGHPLYVKMTPVPGFTHESIGAFAKDNLEPGSIVQSDGLACFTAVAGAGCKHTVTIVGNRKPKDMLEFLWLNTVLGNLKTSLGGAYHAFSFSKYASRYLGAFAYRFNRRFKLDQLPTRLLRACIGVGPRPEAWLRSAETSC